LRRPLRDRSFEDNRLSIFEFRSLATH
jgi:hypothetical protein